MISLSPNPYPRLLAFMRLLKNAGCADEMIKQRGFDYALAQQDDHFDVKMVARLEITAERLEMACKDLDIYPGEQNQARQFFGPVKPLSPAHQTQPLPPDDAEEHWKYETNEQPCSDIF